MLLRNYKLTLGHFERLCLKYRIVEKILLLLMVIMVSSCEETKRPIGTDFPEALLTKDLEQIQNNSIIPGFAVAIIKEDQTVYSNGFGFANTKTKEAFTPNSINVIASISKTFIGVAIMKLVEMGKLDLDEEINNILPFSVVHPQFPDIPIRVKHLATHTSTLIGDFDPEDVGEADIFLLEELTYEVDSIQAIMDEELSYYKLGKYLTLEETLRKFLSKSGKWYSDKNFQNYRPGTTYEYSNMGAELAALIVEIKSEMPFDAFTQEYILDPLGMKNSAWFYKDLDPINVSKLYFPNDWDNPEIAIEHPQYQYTAYPSGGLNSSINDLSLYLMEMIKGFHGGGKLLDPTSYQTLFRPQLDDSFFVEERDDHALNDEYNVGIFWAVSSTGIRLHNGGSIGVYSFMYFNPDSKTGAIGFCNLPDQSFGEIRDAVRKYEKNLSEELER